MATMNCQECGKRPATHVVSAVHGQPLYVGTSEKRAQAVHHVCDQCAEARPDNEKQRL